METPEVLALIEKIILEHKQFQRELQSSEQVANDATALWGLETGQEAFMPGRLNQSQGLRQLEDRLEAVAQGLQAHFGREEAALPGVVRQYGEEKFESGLHSLFLEHEVLRNRLAQLCQQVAELIGGGLSRQLWEASAHDMRAHLTHTRKLLGTHANIEQELLHRLRDRLQEEMKPKAD